MEQHLRPHDNIASASIWSPLSLPSVERERVQQRVREIGQRMRDVGYVLRVVEVANQHRKYFVRARHGYRLQSLAQGPLGAVLLYEELNRSFPDEGWLQDAHNYLSLVQGNINIEGRYDAGLLSGASGLLFISHHLSHNGVHYAKLGSLVVDKIIDTTVRFCLSNEYIYPDSYNLSSGIIGVGATFLTFVEILTTLRMGTEILKMPLSVLTGITSHLIRIIKRTSMQHTHHFASWIPSSKDQRDFYGGYGMWNGLAGVVALLSLVISSNLVVFEPAVFSILQELCDQLCDGLLLGKQPMQWPPEYPGDEYHRPELCSPFSWCSGTSGIARALWLAGKALHNQALCTVALQHIIEMSQAIRDAPDSIDPSLCHGLAGALLVCAFFAAESDNSILSDNVRFMTAKLLDVFEDDRPFGYRSWDPEYIRYDSPWLMDGASGIALSLLATVSLAPPAWARILLLK